jgi:predicted NAD/FAD-binding protein
MTVQSFPTPPRRRIAVVGGGITGLSAAWLLSQRHEVTLYEADDRLGGHSNTVDAPDPDGAVAVDTGFIVYNEASYPNLTALFAYLNVATKPAYMSFAVSMNGGAFEYSSQGAGGLFAQKRNLASPRFWTMLRDLRRFHRLAAADLPGLEVSRMTLGDYLVWRGFGTMFRDHHLLPQAAAIWSASAGQMADYPAAAFIRFYQNHRLLEVDMRPTWRTVDGGSRAYVERLHAAFAGRTVKGSPVMAVERDAAGVTVRTADTAERYDDVVLACHSDQALALLDAPTADETRLLSAVPYQRNRAILHRDRRLMPRRAAAWAAWNHVGSAGATGGGVTYWMNCLQSLPGPPLFVSLNPDIEPDPALVISSHDYEHPVFNQAALEAQREVWSLQGVKRTWFAGAWMGSGFHEDGLQAGLAVAEQLGGVRRPWAVANESGRIQRMAPTPYEAAA